MAHTHWLCAVGWGGCGGDGGDGPLQLLLQRICFGWPTEDVSVDFFSLLVWILFSYLLFRLSRLKNQFGLHLSGRPLMVFDGVGGRSKGVWGYRTSAAVLCESSVGGVCVYVCVGGGQLECFCFFFTPLLSLWGIRGQGGIQRFTITSTQPLLSGILLLSSFLSLFTSSWRQNRYIDTRCCRQSSFRFHHICIRDDCL